MSAPKSQPTSTHNLKHATFSDLNLSGNSGQDPKKRPLGVPEKAAISNSHRKKKENLAKEAHTGSSEKMSKLNQSKAHSNEKSSHQLRA
jgi:hypothetical protein